MDKLHERWIVLLQTLNNVEAIWSNKNSTYFVDMFIFRAFKTQEEYLTEDGTYYLVIREVVVYHTKDKEKCLKVRDFYIQTFEWVRSLVSVRQEEEKC